VPASGAIAVVLNLTAIEPSAPTYLTVYPGGSTRPVASNLNVAPGNIRPNRVIVPLSSSGAVTIYNFSGNVNVAVDVSGYIAGSEATSSGSYYNPVSPARVCDTRPGNPSSLTGANAQCNSLGPLAPASSMTIQVTGIAGVPSATSPTPPTGVLLEVTVVDPSAAGYLSVYPGGSSTPVASDLNFTKGETVANLVSVSLGNTGAISIYNSSGDTNVTVDVEGYDAGATV